MDKQEINNIKPTDVHSILKRKMLVDGLDIVYDMDGSNTMIKDSITNKYYYDMFSFFASLPINHNHPKLNNDEFINYIGKIAIHNPSNSDVYTVDMAKFVATFERVCMPKEFKHLFLISGGTLAVENALKCAIDWKTKLNMMNGINNLGKQILHFKDAFHGRSGYSLSLTNTDPIKYQYYPLFNWPRVDNPYCIFPIDETEMDNKENQTINQILYYLNKYKDDIAAIILEPIQGEGGDNHYRKKFWKKLREICDEYNVLLIADEVQTGLGLTGKMWCYEHYDIVPDIVCFGKKVQVCGFIATNKIDNVKDNVFNVSSRINSTWGGNLVDMVRSQRMIEIIEEENLIENARVNGVYLLDGLNKLGDKYNNLIYNIRGKGLMCAFTFYDNSNVKKFIDIAYDNQLILLSCGTKKDSIRLRPLLDITKDEIDKMLNIMDECMKKLNK